MTRFLRFMLLPCLAVLAFKHAQAATLFSDSFTNWPEPARWSLQTPNADAWNPSWGKLQHKDAYAALISGNGELEDYVAGNPGAFSVDSNGLHIRAVRTSAAQRMAADAAGSAAATPYLSFQSGYMSTHSKETFAAKPGHPLVMRALVTAGMARGLWPALWFLSQAGGWPPEMDAMEIMPATHPNQIHCGIISKHGNLGGWYQLPNGGSWAGGAAHKIMFVLDADRQVAECHVDNVTVASFDVSSRPDVLNATYYMIANVAVAGTWPCNELKIGATNDKSPARMAACGDAIKADYATASDNTGMTIKKLTVDDSLTAKSW